jgi:hypothetical protein
LAGFSTNQREGNVDWSKFLVRLPAVIVGTVGIVERVKGASDENKKEAVLGAVLESVSLTEFTMGKDLLNDEQIFKLVSAVVDAEMAVVKAKELLKAGILAKRG